MNRHELTKSEDKLATPGRLALCGWRQQGAALGLAAGLQLFQLNHARGEDQVSYRYESYQEDGHRIQVETHSGLFEKRLRPWLNVKGEVVYDAISGASPYGAPPPSTINFFPPALGGPTGPFKTTVPLLPLEEDIRWAGTFDANMSLGPHQLTPQFSYSEEHDYVSYGAAVNYSLDLDQKNTTLNLGWSHNWDTIIAKHLFLSTDRHKDSDDFLVGVNQLLGPKTVLTANFTYGTASGYLDDQYKGVLFDNEIQGDPDFPAVEPEKRPSHRDRYIGYVSLTQAVTPLHASVEGSYRYFHDTYGIDAHTIGLAWFQKLGKYVVVSPVFRYYRQSAADFYATRFPDFNNPPPHYSADYRLSELQSWTGGVAFHVKVTDWLGFDAAYKRYVMQGLDGVTSSSAYPSANIYTAGFRLWF